MTIRELIASGTITLDTPVVGDLPMTADRCIIGEGARLWSPNGEGVRRMCFGPLAMRFEKDGERLSNIHPRDCYATMEAAGKVGIT